VGEQGGVLLIENDPDIGMLLVDVLEFAGVPTTLRSGPDELSGDLRPRVVVTDLFGPEWYDPVAAASCVASLRAAFPDVPVVVITAFGEATRDAAALGAHAVIEKPFDIDAVSQLVLSLYGGSAPVAAPTTEGNVALHP
jgi:CheY-like chemotaxis protein